MIGRHARIGQACWFGARLVVGAARRAPAAWPTLAYTALAILCTWPLAAGLGNHLTELGDPLDQVWRLAWGQQQLLRDPRHLFDAPVFYPYPRSYLFDELLLGAAILTLPLRLVTANPVAIYNLAVLASFVLSALAMRALARHLGANRAGAFAAGLIYAFAPLHLDHLPHLSLLSGQYFPLVILLLDRLFHAPRSRDALALAVVLAMQALSSQYYALYLLPVVGGFVALRLLQERLRGRWPSRTTWGALLAAGVLALLPVLPVALGYRAVQQDYGFARTLDENAYYSASLASFITADGRNLVWGTLTAPLRDLGTYTFERNIFPGALALLLAAVGLWAGRRHLLAQYLCLLGLGAALLALGPSLYLSPDNDSLLFAHMPYGFLFDYLPGFDSMRVPARFGILYLLAVAGLASLGLTWLAGRLAQIRPQWSPRLRRGLATALALVLIAGIAGESLARPYEPTPIATGVQVPAVYRWLATQPEAVVIELPFVIPDHGDTGDLYQYYALYHGRLEVNGAANILPKGYQALYYELRDGPTPRALAILQGLGVTDVVAHYDLLDDASAARTRELLSGVAGQVRDVASFGNDVVYRLAPSDHFARLRALIPPTATIYLSRGKDPTGAYGGMLARVLHANPIYTTVRVEFGRGYAGPPAPGARYDYGIFYRDQVPDEAGFADATVVWEDDVVQIYAHAT